MLSYDLLALPKPGTFLKTQLPYLWIRSQRWQEGSGTVSLEQRSFSCNHIFWIFLNIIFLMWRFWTLACPWWPRSVSWMLGQWGEQRRYRKVNCHELIGFGTTDPDYTGVSLWAMDFHGLPKTCFCWHIETSGRAPCFLNNLHLSSRPCQVRESIWWLQFVGSLYLITNWFWFYKGWNITFSVAKHCVFLNGTPYYCIESSNRGLFCSTCSHVYPQWSYAIDSICSNKAISFEVHL